MNEEERRKKVIDALLTIYDNIEERNPCVMDDCTLIKDCKPEDVKFVIKEVILALI